MRYAVIFLMLALLLCIFLYTTSAATRVYETYANEETDTVQSHLSNIDGIVASMDASKKDQFMQYPVWLVLHTYPSEAVHIMRNIIELNDTKEFVKHVKRLLYPETAQVASKWRLFYEKNKEFVTDCISNNVCDGSLLNNEHARHEFQIFLLGIKSIQSMNDNMEMYEMLLKTYEGKPFWLFAYEQTPAALKVFDSVLQIIGFVERVETIKHRISPEFKYFFQNTIRNYTSPTFVPLFDFVKANRFFVIELLKHRRIASELLSVDDQRQFLEYLHQHGHSTFTVVMEEA